MDSNILLETGTGELEIIQFTINDKIYAINVIKVKEVIEGKNLNLTKLPNNNPAIAGLILSRNEILALIDLPYILDKQSKENKNFKIIICEFNHVKVAFKIDNVVGVHRIKWEKIMKPNDLSQNSLVIGNIILDNKITLLLDFEKIVTDINPSSGISNERIEKVKYKDRSNIKLVLADDSPLIRKLLMETLKKAGFTQLTFFDDGKQVLNYLQDLEKQKGQDFTEEVHVLITDIEMPQMDGHTLTRKIKEDPVLKKLPVIIFSSLITDELKHKGKFVKADAQISKPEVESLVSIIDELTNNK